MINSDFSSINTQQAIRNYEETVAAERLARETDLEYLRRTRLDMDDDTRVAYLLWSAAAGIRIRGDVQ